MSKYANLAVGDIVQVGPGVAHGPFIGGVDHFNAGGQPYVIPRSANSPKYLFEDDAVKLTVLEADPADPYEPDAAALAWVEDLLGKFTTDPAKWGVPDTGNEYMIDQRQKVLSYLGGGDEAHHWHSRAIKTFSKLGYITVDARPSYIIGVPFPVRPEDVPPGVQIVVHDTLK